MAKASASGAAVDACPCGSTRPCAQCCAPLHDGAAALTAEALMRSRYSAYVRGLEPYLLQTWDESTRPAHVEFDPATRWLGLKVLKHVADGDAATVEFIAKFKVGGGSAQRLHEISRFRRVEGRWFYIDGEFPG